MCKLPLIVIINKRVCEYAKNPVVKFGKQTLFYHVFMHCIHSAACCGRCAVRRRGGVFAGDFCSLGGT